MSLRNLLDQYKYDEDFIFEGLILDISDQLKEMMEEKGITKKQLADKMGVSPSYITKIFKGSNISLKTVAKVLAALEIEGSIQIKEIKNKDNALPNNDMLKLIKIESGSEDEAKDFSISAA
jgi:transcriptional regulator with XRE-family HTH domain